MTHISHFSLHYYTLTSKSTEREFCAMLFTGSQQLESIGEGTLYPISSSHKHRLNNH